jgi:hypothetical protein
MVFWQFEDISQTAELFFDTDALIDLENCVMGN